MASRKRNSSYSRARKQSVRQRERISNNTNLDSDEDDDDVPIKIRQRTIRHNKRHRSSSESAITAPNSQAACSSKDSKSQSPLNLKNNQKKLCEESDKCPICLCHLTQQKVASPETCDHKFCSPCLSEWAKNVNTCPIDRKEFQYMIVTDPQTPENQERVLIERQRAYVCLQDVYRAFERNCQVCRLPENLLHCTQCTLYYHALCLCLPSPQQRETWQCPYCLYSAHQSNSNPEGHVVEAARSLFYLRVRLECSNGRRSDWLSDIYQEIGLGTRFSRRIRARMQQNNSEGGSSAAMTSDTNSTSSASSTTSGISSLLYAISSNNSDDGSDDDLMRDDDHMFFLPDIPFRRLPSLGPLFGSMETMLDDIRSFIAERSVRNANPLIRLTRIDTDPDLQHLIDPVQTPMLRRSPRLALRSSSSSTTTGSTS